jgi:hypothetical protein
MILRAFESVSTWSADWGLLAVRASLARLRGSPEDVMANSLAKRRYAHGVVASAALGLVALAVAGERSCAEPNKQIIERAQHYKDDVLKPTSILAPATSKASKRSAQSRPKS